MGQVSISPEIGLNYRPYDFHELSYYSKHRTPELYLDLNGDVNLTQRIALHTSIGYIFRKNTFSNKEENFSGMYRGVKFVNKDMNFNIGLLYALSDNIKIGAGGGIFYKINSQILADFTDEVIVGDIENNIIPNLNFILSNKFQKFTYNLSLFYIPETESFLTLYSRGITDANFGLSLGVSYELFKSKSR